MSFHLHQEPTENMQDILRSAVEIVNDDFDYNKFVQAFSNNDPWLAKTKSINSIPSQDNKPQQNFYPNDGLRSCPPMRQQPVFTFDEGSFMQKDAQYQYAHTPNEKTNKIHHHSNNDANLKNKNTNPILKVQITGNPNYELDESDLLNIFSRFGNLINIELGKHRTAYIMFDEMKNALHAQKTLNNQYMRHLDIKLYVKWTNGVEEDVFGGAEELSMVSPNSKGIYNNAAFTSPQNMAGPSSKSLPNLDALPSFPYNPAKFTCKYEIQIDNDKDFKIARKIIGPKGCNMKKIIELCQMQIKRRDITQQSDFLKLRLRGRGSGFKEGPEQRESDDPLHLCVSSKYQEVYAIACKYVEDLLGSLYKEYEVFCQKAGKPLSEPVEMKRIEIINGIEKKPEDANARTTQRKSSIEVNMAGNATAKSMMNINESPNNSLTVLSDKDSNSPKDPRKEFTKSP